MPCFHSVKRNKGGEPRGGRRAAQKRFVSTYEKQIESDGKLPRNRSGSVLRRFRVSHKVAFQNPGTPHRGTSVLYRRQYILFSPRAVKIAPIVAIAQMKYLSGSYWQMHPLIFVYMNLFRGRVRSRERTCARCDAVARARRLCACDDLPAKQPSCCRWEHFPETLSYLTH